MNRRVSQSPFLVTQMAACALILLTLSGCSLFGNTESLYSLLNTNDLSDTPTAAGSDDSEPVDQLADGVFDPDKLAALTEFDEPSTPAVRLLDPEFNQLDASGEASGSGGGHSLAADLVSESQQTYQTMIRPASRTRELFEEPEEQPEAVDPRSVAFLEHQVNAMTPSGAELSDLQNTGPPVQQISAEAAVPEPPQDPARPAPPQEPSMLDRLREFAPDRTGGMLRRQIGRIANPWNLLPGRDEAEEPVPQEPAATAELKPLPQPVMTDPASLGTAELLRTLIDSLERELESWPQTESGSALQPDLYRRRQLNLRLLHLIDDQPAAAAEAIDLMSPQEQEFWQELILGISRFRNPDETIDYDQHIAATIGQLEQAVQQLQPLSSLSIRRVAFCSSINNFGSIEPFPSDTFEPGQRLLIYAEVDNLQSDISPLGTYRTSFSGTLQIVPVTAEEPERPMAWELPTENDDSTTRRADYFASYEFTLPAYLPPGQYEIRLSVHDEISERNATTRLPFSVQ